MDNLILIVSLICASLLYILNLPNKIEARAKEITNLCVLIGLVLWILYKLIIARL
jgi:hypothetical protein